MHPLISHACKTLESPEAPVALRKTALATLCTAAAEGLSLPYQVPRLVWNLVRALDEVPMFVQFCGISKVVDPELIADIVGVLTDPNSGERILDLAVYSFLGESEAARQVSEQDLLRLLETADSRARAARLAQLVRTRHAARALDPELLVLIRDRVSSSGDPGVRKVALDIDDQIPGVDTTFLRLMLADEDAEVRCAVATQCPWDSIDLNAGWGLELVKQAIRAERHPEALSGLHDAQLQLAQRLGIKELPAADPDPEDPLLFL
jgi:hypothetical protein